MQSDPDFSSDPAATAGADGNLLARRILQMVAALHARRCESLYIYCGMAPSGCHWRYSIGAMDLGRWPRRTGDPLQVHASLGGSVAAEDFGWARASDDVATLADKFGVAFPELIRAARVPNPAYVGWYRGMLARSEPAGLLIFYCDYKSDEHPAFWGHSTDQTLDVPPGFRVPST